MSDSLDLQSQIQYLKSLPQYSGMTDDMIEQMIFQEMPQQSEVLTSGDFGMPMDNQIDYGYNTQYPSMTQSDFEIQQQSQKFDLGNTVGNLQNIYKQIGGKEGIAKAKDFLGLGKNAAAGTTLRKLQSTMRNNVNTNYGNRLEMLKTLDPSLLPVLAGQALNTVTPRGLQGLGAGSVAAYGGLVDPTLLAALPLQSPRLMGELALKSGQASRMLGGAPQVAQTARVVGLLEEQIEEDARQSLLNRFGN